MIQLHENKPGQLQLELRSNTCTGAKRSDLHMLSSKFNTKWHLDHTIIEPVRELHFYLSLANRQINATAGCRRVKSRQCRYNAHLWEKRYSSTDPGLLFHLLVWWHKPEFRTYPPRNVMRPGASQKTSGSPHETAQGARWFPSLKNAIKNHKWVATTNKPACGYYFQCNNNNKTETTR